MPDTCGNCLYFRKDHNHECWFNPPVLIFFPPYKMNGPRLETQRPSVSADDQECGRFVIKGD
jgi:hypothetical protein